MIVACENSPFLVACVWRETKARNPSLFTLQAFLHEILRHAHFAIVIGLFNRVQTNCKHKRKRMWFGCEQLFLWGSIAWHPKKRLQRRLRSIRPKKVLHLVCQWFHLSFKILTYSVCQEGMWSVRCMMYSVCHRGTEGAKMTDKYNSASLLLKGFILKHVLVFVILFAKTNVHVCFVFYWWLVIFTL